MLSPHVLEPDAREEQDRTELEQAFRPPILSIGILYSLLPAKLQEDWMNTHVLSDLRVSVLVEACILSITHDTDFILAQYRANTSQKEQISFATNVACILIHGQSTRTDALQSVLHIYYLFVRFVQSILLLPKKNTCYLNAWSFLDWLDIAASLADPQDGPTCAGWPALKKHMHHYVTQQIHLLDPVINHEMKAKYGGRTIMFSPYETVLGDTKRRVYARVQILLHCESIL